MIPKVVQDAIDRFNGVDPDEKAKDVFYPIGRAARRKRRKHYGETQPARSRIQRGRSGPTVRGVILNEGFKLSEGS